MSNKDVHEPHINNTYYHDLAERWYTACDDPIALLRAESRLRNPWIHAQIRARVLKAPREVRVLDVGCGAGFLANDLARQGFVVTGVDLSESSLTVAREKDQTQSVNYILADAVRLPFADGSFEVITSTDFLEHVVTPQEVLREVARVLKPGGLFFFHTFNRTWLAELLVIKGVEWFVKNTPENLHVIDYFIKPEDLTKWMHDLGLETLGARGVRPVFLQKAFAKLILSGEVADDFRFTWTRSLRVSYTGLAQKRQFLN